MEGGDVAQQNVSLSEDTEVYVFSGLRQRQVGDNGARNYLIARELTWTCTQIQITLLPTSTEGLSIALALPVTKNQTQEIMIVVNATILKQEVN